MMMGHLLNGLSIVAAIAPMVGAVGQVKALWDHDLGSVIRLGGSRLNLDCNNQCELDYVSIYLLLFYVHTYIHTYMHCYIINHAYVHV